MSEPLTELLQGYSADALQTMAKFAGLSCNGEGKEACVTALAQALSRRETIEAALSRLDALERLFLIHILLEGGLVNTALMKHEMLHSGFLAESPSATYMGSPYRQMPRYFEDVMARLTAFGLAFTADSEEQGDPCVPKELSPGQRVIIPEPVRSLLPSPWHWLPEIDVNRLSQVREARPEAFQRDLFLLWSYVHRNQVTFTAQGAIPKRHWTRLREQFWGQEETIESDWSRFQFLSLLMEEMGLLRKQGDALETVPGSRSFLGLSLRARTERAFRTWLRSSGWNELARIPELSLGHAAWRDNRLKSAVREGRQFVVGLLKYKPPERWLPTEELIGQAREINPDFLLPHHHNGVSAPHHGLPWELPVYDEAKRWDLLEARFISRVLMEPLYWMGLLSFGLDEGRVIAYRISSLGAQILGITRPEPEAIPKRRLIVQPDFEIYALDPVSDYTLSILDEFAERIKSGHAFEYRLTQESVYQAQQRGMTVAEIIEFLDQESATPVPQNVRLTLQEWGRYHERVVFAQGVSLCQVAEPELLDRLFADQEIAACLGRRVSPTAALVKKEEGGVHRLLRALQSKGVLPTRTNPEGEPVPPLQVLADGSVRFRHPVPDMYLLHQLSPFTRRRRSGELHVTQRAVAEAIASGWTAPKIIELLGALQRGPLPADLVRRIKVWGRYYGSVGLKKVNLLQFDSPQILQELLQDRIIGPLLTPLSFEAGIAIVRDEDLEALKQALAELGVAINEQLRLSQAQHRPPPDDP